MPLGKEIAAELRILADALDKVETSLPTPVVALYNYTDKDAFLAVAAELPRPLKKEYGTHDLTLKSEAFKAVAFFLKVDRSAVCTIVEPAKPAVYDCIPLLSQLEDASL